MPPAVVIEMEIVFKIAFHRREAVLEENEFAQAAACRIKPEQFVQFTPGLPEGIPFHAGCRSGTQFLYSVHKKTL